MTGAELRKRYWTMDRRRELWRIDVLIEELARELEQRDAITNPNAIAYKSNPRSVYEINLEIKGR